MPKLYSKNCDNCGTFYYKKHAPRFCSKKCFGAWISAKSKVKRICITCGKEFLINRNRVNQGRGKNCSVNCRIKHHRSIMKGDSNPHWKGGVTPKTQKRCNSYFWKQLRKLVYKRDNWTCQICGKHCHYDIQCHHKIPYRINKDNSMSNLITLCNSCHLKIEPAG